MTDKQENCNHAPCWIEEYAPRARSTADSISIKRQAAYAAEWLKATGKRELALFKRGRNADEFLIALGAALDLYKAEYPPHAGTAAYMLERGGYTLSYVDPAEYQPAKYKDEIARECAAS